MCDILYENKKKAYTIRGTMIRVWASAFCSVVFLLVAYAVFSKAAPLIAHVVRVTDRPDYVPPAAITVSTMPLQPTRVPDDITDVWRGEQYSREQQ
jgi:hypothetical protein